MILVVCEGKTEARILNDLKQVWRLSTVSVVPIGEVGQPSRVVKRALKERKARKPDETWVVFDCDDHPCWNEALADAAAHGLMLAVSNPCFELWALLLHEDLGGHLDSAKAQKRLAAVHRGYDHEHGATLDRATVEAHLDIAAQRASILAARAEADGDPHRNPTTRFHELIARIAREKP